MFERKTLIGLTISQIIEAFNQVSKLITAEIAGEDLGPRYSIDGSIIIGEKQVQEVIVRLLGKREREYGETIIRQASHFGYINAGNRKDKIYLIGLTSYEDESLYGKVSAMYSPATVEDGDGLLLLAYISPFYYKTMQYPRKLIRNILVPLLRSRSVRTDDEMQIISLANELADVYIYSYSDGGIATKTSLADKITSNSRVCGLDGLGMLRYPFLCNTEEAKGMLKDYLYDLSQSYLYKIYD